MGVRLSSAFGTDSDGNTHDGGAWDRWIDKLRASMSPIAVKSLDGYGGLHDRGQELQAVDQSGEQRYRILDDCTQSLLMNSR
jgi:hypothetical protein